MLRSMDTGAPTPDATPDATSAQALAELTTLGLRVARAITEIIEVEQRTVAASSLWLPAADRPLPASLAEATDLGLGIDGANQALAKSIPHIATLAQSFERTARTIRRTVALARRLEQGWPLPRAMSDNRRAMLLRQAVRGTGDAIRAHTANDAEAAERLFADLSAHLDDPETEHDLLERPLAEMVRMLCRAIGLPRASDTPLEEKVRGPLLGDEPGGGNRRTRSQDSSFSGEKEAKRLL